MCDDISSILNYLLGISSEERIQVIVNFFKQLKGISQSNYLEKWLDHYSFNRLANRLESILESL